MNLLRNTRFTGAALLLLLLLNTTLLVLLFARPAPEVVHHGPPGHERPRDFLVRELKMDRAQEEQYDALIVQHRSQVDHLQAEIRDYREALVLQYNKPATGAIDSLTAEIGKAQAEIERATFLHFGEVRAICTPEQQAVFDRVIRETIRMMGPPPPPPHRPGPH